MKYDAFISYRRENGFLMAQVIRDRLKERGISCFLDLEEDKSGKFDENLLSAIANSPNFILILPKNSLTRCKNEDDWLRREIVAAVRGKKTIIPVMYDGFKWPKKWPDEIPEEIRQVQFQQGVAMSQEYLSAMIEKIIRYMKDLSHTIDTQCPDEVEAVVPKGSVEFFSAIKCDPSDVECVCMAFHSGVDWRRDHEKIELLRYILDNKIQLKVLVNSAESADAICSHMQQPLKKYVGLDSCVDEWMELQALSPETVQVRISRLPLLHRIYLVRRKEGAGSVNVKYYTYGNYTPAKDCRLSFGSEKAEFSLYNGEFEYLWKQAADK